MAITSLSFILILVLVNCIDALPVRREHATKLVHLPLRKLQQKRTNVSPHTLLEQHVDRAYRRHVIVADRAADIQRRQDGRNAYLVNGGNIDSLLAKRYNTQGTSFPLLKNDGTTLDLDANDTGNDGSGTASQGFTPAATPSAPNTLGLDIVGNDVGYFSDITIGSQTFRVLMDSGSADLWVGSEDCQSEDGGSCGNHVFLGNLSSSTFVDTQQEWDITYGSGSVKGTIVTDNVEIAGLKLVGHRFGVANIESTDFSSDNTPFDGLMGLASSVISNQKTPTPVEALAQQGLIQEAITSYKLGRAGDGENDGQITFGGLDETKFDKTTLVTVDNVGNDGFWKANIDKVTANGVDLNIAGQTAILDTGTTLLIAPQANAEQIHQAIGGQASGNGQFIIPCNTNATVGLTFGGQEFFINTKDLAFAPLSTDPNGDCLSGITAGNIGPNTWLVGDTFLKSVYFSTNVNKNSVSLANLS